MTRRYIIRVDGAVVDRSDLAVDVVALVAQLVAERPRAAVTVNDVAVRS